MLELAQAGEPVVWPLDLSEGLTRSSTLYATSSSPAAPSRAQAGLSPSCAVPAQTGTAHIVQPDLSVLISLVELDDAGEPVIWPSGFTALTARDHIRFHQGATLGPF